MKEIRPKINEAELGLILKAMETCGWNEFSEKHPSDPRYQLYRRFAELQRGRHVKKRIIGPFAFALDIRKVRDAGPR
ncbi:hypothetical protein GWN49_00140 [Candidatus Bathyarchaeota archaeon]|nr:hypothetical protein [Candidatus Bathyarchaeota archaeon]